MNSVLQHQTGATSIGQERSHAVRLRLRIDNRIWLRILLSMVYEGSRGIPAPGHYRISRLVRMRITTARAMFKHDCT